MNDIFHEIQEDLHNERLEKLWKKYGSAIITFAVGIVLGTALYVGIDSYRTKQFEKHTEQLVVLTQAVTEGDMSKLDEMVAFAHEVGGDKGAIALLKAGETFRDIGEQDKALEAYEAVSKLSGVDVFYRDLGMLMTVQMKMSTMSARDVEASLAPLTEEGRPLRYTAEELLAYTLMNKGDYKAASLRFQELADDTQAPVALQQRAAALANIAPAAGEEVTAEETTSSVDTQE